MEKDFQNTDMAYAVPEHQVSWFDYITINACTPKAISQVGLVRKLNKQVRKHL